MPKVLKYNISNSIFHHILLLVCRIMAIFAAMLEKEILQITNYSCAKRDYI